jgi:hypothetical protein
VGGSAAAADEGINARVVAQHDRMLEKSWDGLMEHTATGFNIGKPPYGYQVIVERHPVPT